jgi:rubrerythrin
MTLKGSQTEKNLLTAFAGESQARNRYLFYAKQAKKEGYEQIRAIFEETAEQEGSHAKLLFRHLEGGEVQVKASFPAGVIDSTLENLQQAVSGEAYENREMYPGFAVTAEQEGFRQVAGLFKLLAHAEQYHEKRFRKLAERIAHDTLFKREAPTAWVCRKCGYIHEGTEPPEICPLCRHPKAYFEVEAENY